MQNQEFSGDQPGFIYDNGLLVYDCNKMQEKELGRKNIQSALYDELCKIAGF